MPLTTEDSLTRKMTLATRAGVACAMAWGRMTCCSACLDDSPSTWALSCCTTGTASRAERNASAMYPPPRKARHAIAHDSCESRMPSFGSPKYRKNSCTSDGVLRLNSTYAPATTLRTGTRHRRITATRSPMSSAKATPPRETTTVTRAAVMNRGAYDPTKSQCMDLLSNKFEILVLC